MKIERDLIALLPREAWIDFSHRLIWHGRRVCIARRPQCDRCVLADLCPSAHVARASRSAGVEAGAARRSRDEDAGAERWFDAFVDGAGRRWRVARAFAGPLRRALSMGRVRRAAAGGGGRRRAQAVEPARRLGRSRPTAPPLVLALPAALRPVRPRARPVATRAFAELRSARRLIDEGLAVARPLAVVEPPSGRSDAPAWPRFDAHRRCTRARDAARAALPAGRRAPAKLALARRALTSLRALHEAGLWHRDFHGGNLLLREAEGPGACST